MPGVSVLNESEAAKSELVRDEPRYKSKRLEAWADDLDAQAAAFANREKATKTLLAANKPVNAAAPI